MCTVDDKNQANELTGLAARFIAETNAFLDHFWAHPDIRWPMKCPTLAAQAAPAAAAPAAEPCPGLPTAATGPGDLAAVPELVARMRRLQRAGANGASLATADADGEPRVYVILLLVPEEAPCPSAESLIRAAGVYGVRHHNGHPISVDLAPPPPAAAQQKQPRRRCKTPSAA